MTFANLSVLVSYAVQAVESLVLAALLFGFDRTYNRRHLRLWGWSWLALAVYFATAAYGFVAAMVAAIPPSQPSRLAASLVSLTAVYWQVALLLAGTRELTTGKTIRRSTLGRLLAALVAAAALATFAYAFEPGATAVRHFIRVGLKSLVAGVGFTIAGVAVWRSRRRATVGPVTFAAAFLAYGLTQLHDFVLSFAGIVGGLSFVYPAYLGFVSMLLQMAMGLGMVIWFLEEERLEVLRAGERVDYLTNYDQLTGLPNRRLFVERLGVAVEADRAGARGLALAVLDIDRFEVINTSLGHSSGDEVLRLLGQRLAGDYRTGEIVARIGEDEFALLLVGEPHVDAVRARVERLLTAVRRPFLVQRREVFVTVSAGVALFPAHGTTAQELLRHAEGAVQVLREAGRDGYAIASGVLPPPGPDTLSLEADLRRAAEREEFIVHYQPIFALDSRRLVAVEALVRWQHPTRGLLLPRDFLGLAEEIGILDSVEAWVLATACAQLREWRQVGLGGFRLAVNVSAQRFRLADTVAAIQRTVEDAGIAPGDLIVEITENAAMKHSEATQRTLASLRDLGITVAIDDFGTGYSSLSYLSSLPVGEIKIDRSFVAALNGGPEAAAIVAAIVALGHALRLTVVAEGVEREDQLADLARLGCDQVQGFLLAEPCPGERCADLLPPAVVSTPAPPASPAR